MSAQDRLELRERLEQEAKDIRARLAQEVGSYQPLGRLSDLACIAGYSGRGVPITTPFGTLAFAKARKPSTATVERWTEEYRRSEELVREAVSLTVYICDAAGTTIGNRLPLEKMQELEARGLLDPDEVVYVRKLETFWNAHPDADSGVVETDGTIRPWFKRVSA